MNPIAAYTNWLHTRWPAGKPEKLPIADERGRTNVKGLYIVGDLTGIPLLKLSANAGVNAVREIAEELKGESAQDGVLDVAIIGGGTSGFAAATECEELGLKYCVFEASKPFSTIKDFPKGKPIFTYPTDTPIEGRISLHEKSDIKEGLIEDLEEQTVDTGLKWVKGNVTHIEKGSPLTVVLGKKAETPENVHLNGTGFVTEGEKIKAKRVIVGIGRSGNYRSLGVPGEGMTEKVSHRLHDPADYCGKNILIVGGGDSALETAIALTKCGADVTLSYRKPEFNRPKPENAETIAVLAQNPEAEVGVEQSSDPRQSSSVGEWMKDDGGSPPPNIEAKGTLKLLMNSDVTDIRQDAVDIKLKDNGETTTVENDQVFLMIGREAPLGFFRKSGVRIRGERTLWWWTSLILFLTFCMWMYHWKAGKGLLGFEALAPDAWPGWLVWEPSATWQAVTGLFAAPFTNYFRADDTLGGVIVNSMGSRSFYYSLAYSLCVVIFGIDRIMRRKTPYVKVQTYSLMAIQVIPLFLLPEIILPYMGATGWFDGGPLGWIADQLFPGGSYWRAYGLILAWPLMAWNWFTGDPIWGWLILGFVQTFMIIPAMVYYLGKGSYCGWVCSCGALAETLGDRHREKMPHGPFWNRFNMVGQAILAFSLIIMAFRLIGWLAAGKLIPGVEVGWLMWAEDGYEWLANKAPLISFAWFVDLLWAGVLGVGLYFWFSGRFWCRFACPLAALMHIYHRFGQFAIIPDKKKCISCNVCTSVCHQGIDIMSFANKGRPMRDPECVRCSACVQMCPTGVLSFGRVNKDGVTIAVDGLAASPVRMKETQLTVNGKALS
ncbi:MAG: NAD(P)-binding domain-containing protein [Planctomycetota bacterium]